MSPLWGLCITILILSGGIFSLPLFCRVRSKSKFKYLTVAGLHSETPSFFLQKSKKPSVKVQNQFCLTLDGLAKSDLYDWFNKRQSISDFEYKTKLLIHTRSLHYFQKAIEVTYQKLLLFCFCKKYKFEDKHQL